ncbi:MAG: hypothetical protein CSB19_01595 [Clostridiales bacterium]|nr:MAG: hypothetical protein CSB19_01595 [Clostridiales bacterium]
MKTKVFTVLLLIVLLLAGCSSSGAADSDVQSRDANAPNEPVVYTTIYPVYALTEAVAGNVVEVRVALPFGVDPHDFEPSAKLIGEMSKADVVFYNGLAMEPWLERAYDSFVDNGVMMINLSEAVEPIPFSGHISHDEDCDETHDANHAEKCGAAHDADHAEKCDAAHDADHAEKHHEEHDADHVVNHDHEGHQHGNLDPHIWQDPLNAMAMVDTIYATLNEKCSPQSEAQLLANYKATKRKLTALDESYRTALDGLARREIVVGHAAFGYLCHRYELQQIAVAGLSTHDEPSAALIAQIADLSEEHGVKVVFYDALGSDKLAKVVADEIGVALKPLNPIGVITTEQLESGEDYFTLMEENLQAIRAALTN